RQGRCRRLPRVAKIRWHIGRIQRLAFSFRANSRQRRGATLRHVAVGCCPRARVSGTIAVGVPRAVRRLAAVGASDRGFSLIYMTAHLTDRTVAVSERIWNLWHNPPHNDAAVYGRTTVGLSDYQIQHLPKEDSYQ